jgi:hypothetical protein
MGVAVAAASCGNVEAQNVLNIHRTDHVSNIFHFEEINQVQCSRTDLEGVEHDNYVVQEVYTTGGVYRVPLSIIDSVNFVQDAENVTTEIERDYFTITDATFTEDAFPEATTTETISNISVNQSSLAGGMNYITVTSTKKLVKFYIGVRGSFGYWSYEAVPETSLPAQAPQTRAAADEQIDTTYTYFIPLTMSTSFSSSFTLVVTAEDEDGNIMEKVEKVIEYVSSQSGDLNINLTFSNAKDVDLHLYMPDGQHIYYANRGGSTTLADGTTVSYGLDHDSNAACNIDNLNNENIYIPAELIQDGTYKVVVNMWRNCDSTTATTWTVATRYKGAYVDCTSGANPATGVYPIGAGSGDMTVAMTFTISGGTLSSAERIDSSKLTPRQRTEIDEWKLQNE